MEGNTEYGRKHGDDIIMSAPPKFGWRRTPSKKTCANESKERKYKYLTPLRILIVTPSVKRLGSLKVLEMLGKGALSRLMVMILIMCSVWTLI